MGNASLSLDKLAFFNGKTCTADNRYICNIDKIYEKYIIYIINVWDIYVI